MYNFLPWVFNGNVGAGGGGGGGGRLTASD